MDNYKTESGKIIDLKNMITKEKNTFEQVKRDFLTEINSLKNQVKVEKEKYLNASASLRKQPVNGKRFVLSEILHIFAILIFRLFKLQETWS